VCVVVALLSVSLYSTTTTTPKHNDATLSYKQYDECLADLQECKDTLAKARASLAKGQAKLAKLEADGAAKEQLKTEHTAQFDELNREIEEAKIVHAQTVEAFTVAKRPMVQLKAEENRIAGRLKDVKQERTDSQR
jgi:chromosome segregation ATPase